MSTSKRWCWRIVHHPASRPSQQSSENCGRSAMNGGQPPAFACRSNPSRKTLHQWGSKLCTSVSSPVQRCSAELALTPQKDQTSARHLGMILSSSGQAAW
eukprot:354292-Chlamydomonas_euryale.AAC.2